MNYFGFETLLKERDLKYTEKWVPTTVPRFCQLIKQGILKDIDEPICRNVAYNLQYLQYIDLQMKELKLHSVIYSMLCKTFIITSMSIIEAIFYYILKNNNQNKTSNMELIFSTKSNKKKYEEDELIVETNVYKIVEPKRVEMSLDSMIKKMEKKGYLDLKHNYFPYLKHFKDLRNKIHIHISEDSLYKTDYWQFENADVLFVKYMLLNILTDGNISPKFISNKPNTRLVPKEYHFLAITDEEIDIIKRKYDLK